MGVPDLAQPRFQGIGEVVDNSPIRGAVDPDRAAPACGGKVVEHQLGGLPGPKQRLPDVARPLGDAQRTAGVRGQARNEPNQASHDTEQRSTAVARQVHQRCETFDERPGASRRRVIAGPRTRRASAADVRRARASRPA